MSAQIFVIAFVVTFAITLFGTILCSIRYKHVNTFLPLLSTAASNRPESYLFAFGMVASGTLWIEICSFQFWNLWKTDSITIKVFDVFQLIFGIISGLCLSGIGLFNYEGDTTLHIIITNAFIFFGILMFISIDIISFLQSEVYVCIWRLVSSILCLFSSYAFCSFYGYAHRNSNFDNITTEFIKENTDEQGNKIEEVVIPLSLKISAVWEYLGVLFVCVFILSYIVDLQHINFQISN